MFENGRFCVQFSGTNENSVVKTKIFYKNKTTTDDIRDVWRMVYSLEAPQDICLCIRDQAYSLTDQNDFDVVMAIAEDHYRANPSKPLHITLSDPREYKPVTPPSSNPSPEQHLKVSPKVNHSNKESFADQNMKCHTKENNNSISSSPTSESFHRKKIKPEIDHNAVVHDLSLKKIVKTTQNNYYTNSNEISSILNSNYQKFPVRCIADNPVQNPAQSHMTKVTCQNSQPNFLVPHQTGSSLFSLGNPAMTSTLLNALMQQQQHQLQQQRFWQSNAKVQPMFQSFMKNLEKISEFNQQQSLANSSRKNLTTYNESKVDPRFFHDRKESLPMLNGTSTQQVPKQKRRKLIKEEMDKERCGRRMRSSSSQSNIDYHCDMAMRYMSLTPAQKKEHNSAHRSHWKHLFHVTSIWPEFQAINKYKKYDEWSSEARDIYAITLPEEYKWSFLTLAKQGDQLCKRIKSRVEAMQQTPESARQAWYPSNETLKITWDKADERLKQLERIREARLLNKDQQPQSTASPSRPTSSKYQSSSSSSSLLSPDAAIRTNMFANGSRFFDAGNFARYNYPFPSCPSNPTSLALTFNPIFQTAVSQASSSAGNEAPTSSSEFASPEQSTTSLHHMHLLELAKRYNRTAALPISNSIKDSILNNEAKDVKPNFNPTTAQCSSSKQSDSE